ncbi:unnamed protein product [Auanema sp. JU1783]|nr:unnamed protein product [Auanema sp. JU1783]
MSRDMLSKFNKLSLMSGNERTHVNQQLHRQSSKYPKHSPNMLQVVSDMSNGGKIDYCTNEKGNIYMSVKYDRNSIIHYAYSPFSALPPAEMKHISDDMPEIITDFPVLHGVDCRNASPPY